MLPWIVLKRQFAVGNEHSFLSNTGTKVHEKYVCFKVEDFQIPQQALFTSAFFYPILCKAAPSWPKISLLREKFGF